MKNEQKKTNSELWRDVLRLYVGAGLNAALTVGSGVLGVSQIKQGEHVTTAMLVMAGVFFAHRMVEKVDAGKKAMRQVNDRKKIENQKTKGY